MPCCCSGLTELVVDKCVMTPSRSMSFRQIFNYLLVALAVGIAISQLIVPSFSRQAPSLEENMQDQGFVLVVTQELLQGRVLYEQIFTPYGPIPHLLYAGFARLCGNSPANYEGYQHMLDAVILGLIYLLLRRYLSVAATLLIYVLALSHFEATAMVYFNCDLICVLLLSFVWKPIEDRTWGRCLLYGFLFGMLHFSKFGGQIVAALAFILIEILQSVGGRAYAGNHFFRGKGELAHFRRLFRNCPGRNGCSFVLHFAPGG